MTKHLLQKQEEEFFEEFKGWILQDSDETYRSFEVFKPSIRKFTIETLKAVVEMIGANRLDCPHDSRSHCMEEMCWINEIGGFNEAIDLLKSQIQDMIIKELEK